MDSVNFFSNRYTLYSFSPILTKFGIGLHDLCANTKKIVEQIFDFKFVGDFLNFKSAVELSRPLGLL